MTTLTLIGKPNCHLCDVAREVVETVVAEMPEDAVVVDELSILEDPADLEPVASGVGAADALTRP